MSELILARIQFASTTIFHFFFVPLSIGLAFLVALMETLYVVKKQEIYKEMSKFWGKFFLINFAVGVVTGIIQEFQFGMNWSDYSRFVGDVFGPPLAIEALLAFFMESTFIGLWIFGWNRLPKKIHLLSIWLVSFGTAISALWILAANSFMQNPVGYTIQNGRAEMNNFLDILTNEKLLVAYPHTIFASLTTAAFLVGGISAWNLLKKRHIEFFKRSAVISLIIGLVSSLGVAFSGHTQAQYLVSEQPMKMAAAEALWEDSGDPASWTVIAGIDTENKDNTFQLDIPYALSFLSYGKFSGDVKGMNTIQEEYEQLYGEGDYIPPVKTTFWSFRIMVAAGGLMILLSFIGLVLHWRQKLPTSTRFLKWMIPAIFLPYIANTSGWIMSEIGRQPWVVNGLMLTSSGVSPSVSSGQILFSLIAFSLIYTLLAIAMVFLFVKVIKKGPYASETGDATVTDPFSTGRVG
ncbi:cytochrome ubiquinol oxidase subunit I [Fervidibacillus albus]|uniref:Cytochrome ubiquinol oxidase subunit I n=1 Tax=Fervidibacillus albus TaxID=2980026 RepID=A0A9E8RV03_9BACI|nr:cytochrome ubiquinol oxidase subunit I [Fervidibacillus albus]WAA08804.1 cytochrome ubiquinol oxidase subunit I [Fervidibacillus albus]